MLRRSVSTASATPGYWTFTATSRRRACVRGRPGRSTPRRPASRRTRRTRSPTGPPSSASSTRLHLLERHGRRVVAQRGELLLELLALVLGHEVEVDRREDLADLHRRALHLPELLDELVGHRDRVVALPRRPGDHASRSARSGRCGRWGAWALPRYGSRGAGHTAHGHARSAARRRRPVAAVPRVLRAAEVDHRRRRPAGQRAAGHGEPRAVGDRAPRARARSSCASAPRRRSTARSSTRPTTPTARRCPTSSRASGRDAPEFFGAFGWTSRATTRSRPTTCSARCATIETAGRRRRAALHRRPRHVPVRLRAA